MTKRNKQLAEKFRAPCIICGQDGNGDHILNFKRIPSRDAEWNLWSLCFTHHREKTDMALTRFVEKYRLWDALKEKGFFWLEASNKYWHESA
jgi:5-methylcytosine-specific restriction endonuclease McrA